MHIKLAAFVLSAISIFATTWSANALPPERWVEARSAHFVVLSDASERTAQRTANQFERMHLVFHTLSPTRGDDSDLPITVIAVKDRKGLQALEPAAYLEKNKTDLAGLFLRTTDKNYILIRLDANESHAYSTVYHEYTHYMLRKADGWLPLWLNEGLAQFYENTDIDAKTAWLGETNAEELRYLKRNDMLPIETLLKIDARSPYYHDGDKSSIFYSESWAMTHYLVVSDRLQGTHRMRDYCQLLARGQDSVVAARQAFGDLDKLQTGLDAYVMQQKFMYFMMPAKLPANYATFEVRRVGTSDADAMRADVLAYTGRSRDALALLDRVLAEDRDNELAHQTMGYLAYRAGDVDGARDWYAQAVKLDSHSYLAQYYFARMSLHVDGHVDDGQIESGLRAAIHLNPEFAPAYDELAMLYALRNRNLDEAHVLNLRAIELDPSQLVYQLNCAEVLAEKQQFAEALGVLQGAMRLAKTPYEVDAVTSRVARVERYSTAAGGAPTMKRSLSGFGQ